MPIYLAFPQIKLNSKKEVQTLEVEVLSTWKILMIDELICKTSREVPHGALNTFSSSPLSEHIPQAQNQNYRWQTSLFPNVMLFIGLQTTTIIKPEYSTILSPPQSGFPSCVSLPSCFYKMKCDKTCVKVIWKTHISNSSTYKLE